MTKLFRHKNIIKKYAVPVSVTRETKGQIIAGVPKIIIETLQAKAAILEPTPLQLEDNTGFLQGDRIIYFIKNEEYTPMIGDVIVYNSKKYKLEAIGDSELLADYTRFLARRVVDDY